MNTGVDNYLMEGCGRCPLGGTPECKVNNWQEELKQLRRVVLECGQEGGLSEEIKWGVPTYTFRKRNIVTVSALKEYCALGFFKGALLHDAEASTGEAGGLLVKPGENTQAARVIKFTSVQEILKLEPVVKAYIYEAIEVEEAGLEVRFEKNPEPIPEEFQKALDENQDLKAAFDALTSGRQRGYLLHFSQAKQSKTRKSRIEKCMARIYAGKGLNEY